MSQEVSTTKTPPSSTASAHKDAINTPGTSPSDVSEGATLEHSPRLPAIEFDRVVPSSQALYEDTRRLITACGGMFIGIEELTRRDDSLQGRIYTVPPLPASCTPAFLQSPHPLRDGLIASHAILALDFDRRTKTLAWHMIDRGTGGATDIIPGSLGVDGNGLPGRRQDELLRVGDRWLSIHGVSLAPPENSFPIERVLNHAIRLHLESGKPLEKAPFFGVWARTGDTERCAMNCRALLGMSKPPGILVQCLTRGDLVSRNVGLLGEWKFPDSATSIAVDTGVTPRGSLP